MTTRLSRISLGFLLAAIGSGASAAAVIGATSISSPQGNNGGAFDIANIINQSSLSAAYTSGVTDFASYTATTTSGQLSGSGFTATSSSGPQQFTFDLGALYDITGLAIWNTNSVGAVTRIELYADTDTDFGNGGLTLVLGPSSIATNSASADVFSFASVQARYFHVQGLASLSPPDFYGLNEVAFGGTVAGGGTVPAPGGLALAGLALAALGLTRRRRAR